jgi:hypothetical protein
MLLEKIIFNSRFDLIITTFIFEFVIFLGIYLIYLNISKHNEVCAKIVFFILYGWHTLSTIATSYYLDDAFGRGYSYFGLSFGNAEFILKNLIPWVYLILVILGILTTVFVAYIITKYIKFYFDYNALSKKSKYILISILMLIVLILPLFGNHFDHIYVNTLNDAYQKTFVYKAIYPDFNCDFNNNLVDKTNYLLKYEIPKYNKIVVFVMEELSYFELEKDLSKLSVSNFWVDTKKNSEYYYNYYTSNQDSVPAITSMLSSKFTPNEAYIYDSVNFSPCAYSLYKEYNLVDYFNDLDFKTYFVVSHVGPSCELTKYNWSKIIDLNGSTSEYKDKYLCLNPYPYDNGCEDLALLDNVIDLLKKDKVFIMQEFIFGHNPGYVIESKMSKTEYYNKFFTEYYKEVKELNLDSNLLTIIVSDHGNKWSRIYNQKYGYNVPLIVLANDLNYAKNNDFYSHLDFKNILFSYLYDTPIKESNGLYLVGPTGSNTIGYMNEDSFFTIKTVSKEYKLVTNKIKSINNQDVSKLLGCYLNYKKSFN